ncbi:patched domain-containing protein 3-like [Ylistrum balloti]|uniref:patched domain-containing protein 3-like n=1 Tax=Ylistrum balloti TaxID=509963 RepID=UPI002905E094|nr:patched domain-containing protein 3-like [Ylistrum balloti]
MSFTRHYKKWEEKLGIPFEKYGVLVSRYPWHVLIGCVTINCLFGMGLLWIEIETDIETLYTLKSSPSKAERAAVKAVFTEDKSGSNFYFKNIIKEQMFAEIIVKTKDGSNILTVSYLDEIERIYNYIIDNVNITSDGTTLGFPHICALRRGNCVVEGDAIFSKAFRNALTANNINYPLFNFEYLAFTFGDVQSSGGYLTSARMIKLTFFLRQDTTAASTLSQSWEKRYIQVLAAFSSSFVDIAFATSSSIEDELEKSVTGDILYFVLTIVIMLTYAGLVTSGGDCVSDRQNLGRAGVFATCIAIFGALGLVSAVGVKFVNFVGTLPFLIIGIGLDDMFILMSCLADCSVKGTIEDRIKKTIRTGGVAITITSITDFLAFAIGASASFISVRNFCVYAGVAVFLCYINQLTFFIPCMVINERRIVRNDHCGTCHPIKPREELRMKGKSNCYIFCCGGQAPKNRKDNESPLEKYPKYLFQYIVQNPAGKIAIIVLFVAYLTATVYGVMNFKQGLLFSNLVTEDSYYYTYSKLDENHFTSEFAIGFTITSKQNYSDVTTQSRVSDLLSNARADVDINSNFRSDWLTDYKSSGIYNGDSEASFIAGLKTFLTIRTDHANDVVLSSAETSIVGARFFILTNDLPETEQKTNVMLRMREVADKSPLPVVCFSWPFIFFDEYTSVFSTTFTTVGIAIAAMFVVTVLFMPHPLLVVCVTGTMVMICAGVFGFMYYWDLALSVITMIEIIMSIGFSADFSAHICHAYITVDGATRKERVHKALDRSGGPIINAAVSSIFGIMIMAFSSSYIFKSFFKLMFLVMVLGLAHALLLLPLIFSVIGPVTELTVTNTSSGKQVYFEATSVQVDRQTNTSANKPESPGLYNVSMMVPYDLDAKDTPSTQL